MPGFIGVLSAAAASIYLIYLALKPKQKTVPAEMDAGKSLLTDLKSTANSYVVDFDNCTFKDSSYASGVQQANAGYSLAGHLVGSEMGAFYTPVEKTELIQSVLFFKDQKRYDGKRFFHTFPFDQTTLKFHVVSGNITLYIDRLDPDKYVFELVPNQQGQGQ